MVYSVPAISTTKKVTRDGRGSSNGYSKNSQSPHTFSKVLEAEVNEQKAPTECHTVTYGSDSRLRTFLYQTRDYQY